ncbi:MAG: hypothetical protein C0501_25325 [Isosphaera sp.]|nr:hypothetical protein [Isosphaera sp.]
MSDPERTDPARPNSLPWILLSGVVGLYAVGTPAPPAAPPAPKAELKPAAKEPAPEKHVPVPVEPLLKPLQDFHATTDGAWSPDDLPKDAHGYRTEFLVATVPDPIDSPFGYAFDQAVDAIQRAVQQKSGYLLDRAWLPWEADRQKPHPGKDPTRLRETTPGVLLFRHGKDAARGVAKPGLCVVFLVGETPVGGIHKPAFTRCLTLIDKAGRAGDAPVRVVGPYFTGSQTSLQFVVDDWLRASGAGSWLGLTRPARFQVVVGNASGMRTKEFFRAQWGEDRVSIAATVAPARVQLNAVLHFLAGRDAARAGDPIGADARLPGPVAILTESNTGFGKQMAAQGGAGGMSVLRFPLHVSRLKSEYAQLFRKRDEQAGLPAAAATAGAGFEDAGGSSEGVPAQGGAATVAANNAVLANILSTISRERFRYVGVLATDPRDKLFLIRLVREFCPDVHVFVTQADLLLTHPDYLYHMKGVVVGSTYPLYPPGQAWSNPDAAERLMVPSAAAQGYYNATLALLGQHDKMVEYGPPGFAAGPGVPTDRPPVWVSMVAPSGTLVPLQVFTGYDDPGGYVWRKPGGGSAPAAAPLPYPGAAVVAGVGLAALWAVLAALCWRGRGVWGVGAAGPASAVGVFRTLLLGAQGVFAAALVAVTSARAEHEGYAWPDAAVLAAAGLAWLLFVVTALRGVSFRRGPGPSPSASEGPASTLAGARARTDNPGARRRWRWGALNLLVILLLVGVTAAFLGRFWGVSDRPHRALFFARAVDLGSGLSPLTPLFLMCAAVTAGAYFQLERHHLAGRCRVPSPFPSDPDRVFDPLTDQDRRLKVEMTPGRFWRRHRAALSVVFAGLAGGGVTVWRHSLPTVEGAVWDGLFAAGFAGVYAFAALTIFQTVALWRQTKQLLRTLARTPVMRVFARLPSRVTGVVTKTLYSRGGRPLMTGITVHQLRQLADAAAADPSAPEGLRGLGPVADEVAAKWRAVANPGRKGGDPADEAAVRDALADVAGRGLAALAPRWKGLPTDEAFGGSPADDAPAEPAWVARAEELAATQLVTYLSQFFIQLRSLMLAVLVCSSLLLVAATSYPFHPERLLLVSLLGLVGVGVGCVAYVFLDMSLDEAVGRVSRSGGRFALDGGFLSSFFTYVVPTLGILAAQLSGTFRWALEPILRVVK